MNRTIWRLASAGLLLLGLVAAPLFAGGAQEEAIPEKAEILIWGWPSADKAFEAIYPGFQTQYPGIKVTWEMRTGGTNGVRDGLVAAIAAGSGAPDISMIEINHIDGFVVFGGLEDLLAKPYSAGQYKKDFVEYKWRQASTPDGKQLFAFPWDIGPATVFYRRDLLEAAGVASDPESVAASLNSWSGYLTLGRKVNDPGNNVYWIDNASGVPYIYFSHKNIFDKALNVAVDNGRTRQVLKVAKELRNSDMDMRVDFWTEEWYAGLNNGNIATSIVGCWFGGFLKSWIAADTAGMWGIVPVPEDPLQNWGGSFMAIPKQGKNKLAAWKFIEYSMATSEAQNKMFETVDYFPAYKPAWDNSMYDEGDPFFGGQKTRRMWADIATSQGPFVTTALDAAAEPILVAEVAKFLDQNLEVEKTIATIVREIEKQTAEDKEVLREIFGL
jgi:multiple sugar transport system substrate-binding protein